LPFDLRWQNKFKGLYTNLDSAALSTGAPQAVGASSIDRKEVVPRFHFLMPETYMNLSGESVQAAAAFFKIPLDRILVVHDELELALGLVSLKLSGGLGGHNGLRSMRTCFGAVDFWRFRIGIGRPEHRDIAGWVLSDFTAGETPLLDQVLDACAGALIRILLQGPETLLPEFTKKDLRALTMSN
jgi:PTH1 family peptidyl-tRNA hydrolase